MSLFVFVMRGVCVSVYEWRVSIRVCIRVCIREEKRVSPCVFATCGTCLCVSVTRSVCVSVCLADNKRVRMCVSVTSRQ